jgi:hypothetical protein
LSESIQFYNTRIASFSEKRDALKKTIHRIGSVRLLLVAGAVLTVWYFRESNWVVWTGIFAAYAIPFIVLMVYHTKLFHKKEYAEAIIRLNENELKGIDYDFSPFDGAAESVDSHHPFSTDLDLFGDKSLFQSLNRTITRPGKAYLTNLLINPLDQKQAILNRQQAIRELAGNTHFRQHFYVTGALQTTEGVWFERLQNLSKIPTRFSKNRFWKTCIWIVPLLWTVVIIGFLVNIFPLSVAVVMFSCAFLLAFLKTLQINNLHQSVENIERILLTYSRLIEQIEKESFNSKLLISNQNLLNTKGKRASAAIRRLSKIIAALNQRHSLAGVLLNLLYLRDMRYAMQLERWVETYADEFTRWFESLGCMDAMCSLGGFAFNHPDYVYPEIADTYFEMKGKALGHPLIHRDVCVRNDLQIEKNPFFLIVTGANMAGKSTYLRTVGVNFLMACMGLPVCAESLTVCPAHLITSLRTADSLTANESYFFAELKRLKMIIDRLNEGEKLFILLDEILKGTNSEDKQKGSLALMKQLIAKNTCGIIATHDLLLGSLAQAFPEQIKNYRFEADMTDDELTFSYRLREGIARNMNACFLMGKMGITIDTIIN